MDDTHAEAYERLTEELDAYHELLRFGSVTADVDDPEAWRAEIEGQSRADNIVARSFVLGRAPSGRYRVWAGRERGHTLERLTQGAQLVEAQDDAARRASLRGHAVVEWLRVLDDEAAGRCVRCGARVYVNAATTPPTLAGEVFEEDCPA